MKNFIVPIDFSDDSIKGLEIAILFSQKTHVNIQMVYVQKKSIDIYAALIHEEAKLAERRFEHLIRKYTPLLKHDSKLRYIVKKGRIYEEVVNQAHSYKDSVIAASTHGASGFEELFIGSNAYKIICASDKPVITIRKGAVPKEIRKIVLPIDVVPETRQKVDIAVKIAQLFGSEIHVVAVSTSQSKKVMERLDSYTRQVSKHLRGVDIPFKTDFQYGSNIADLTVNYAKKVKAELIIIMTEMGYGFSNIFVGGYAQQMLSKAEVPVLNLKPKEVHLARDFSTFGE
jgi:nucleotide-binding universal stress UspA family protein